MRVSPEPFAINLLAQEHLARVRGFYDQVKVGLKPGARHYRAMLAQYYRHIVPADASVLEIGCGQGDLLRLLPNRDVTGVDVSPGRCERARANVPHGVFHVMAGEELRLDRTFDYILLSDTANEAADVQALLEAALTAARARHPPRRQYLQRAVAAPAGSVVPPGPEAPASPAELVVDRRRRKPAQAGRLGTDPARGTCADAGADPAAGAHVEPHCAALPLALPVELLRGAARGTR
jgi:SAM-dependent methyltransferase